MVLGWTTGYFYLYSEKSLNGGHSRIYWKVYTTLKGIQNPHQINPKPIHYTKLFSLFPDVSLLDVKWEPTHRNLELSRHSTPIREESKGVTLWHFLVHSIVPKKHPTLYDFTCIVNNNHYILTVQTEEGN